MYLLNGSFWIQNIKKELNMMKWEFRFMKWFLFIGKFQVFSLSGWHPRTYYPTYAISGLVQYLGNNLKSSTNAFILYLDNDCPHLAYVFVINFCILHANWWLRKNHLINFNSDWSDCFLDAACKTSPGNFYWCSTFRIGFLAWIRLDSQWIRPVKPDKAPIYSLQC